MDTMNERNISYNKVFILFIVIMLASFTYICILSFHEKELNHLQLRIVDICLTIWDMGAGRDNRPFDRKRL